MNKFPIAVILLVILSLFATADLYLNKIDLKSQASPAVPIEPTEIPAAPRQQNKIQPTSVIQNYQNEAQYKTTQLFDKIDLSSIENIENYQNHFTKIIATEDSAEPVKFNFYLYEIIGPGEQGDLTYLNVKLQTLAQIDNTTITLNETNHLGQKSFFLNDQNYPNTAFLLVQAGSNLYGFQYSKENTQVYEDIKTIINHLSTP